MFPLGPIAQPVLNGHPSLADANKETCRQENEYNSDEQRLLRLRNEQSDLAEKVDSEKLTLNEAEAATD